MKILILVMLLMASSVAHSSSEGNTQEKSNSIKILSLNLHGYHPTGELPRWFQSRDGAINQANPNIFFFKEEEVARGHALRIDRLSKDINGLSPDIIFLQEVGAGAPSTEKNCNVFYRRDLSKDSFELNSAVKLHKNLATVSPDHHYNLALACRGNIGWVTDKEIFAKQRIVVFPNNNVKETPRVIFDFDSNPYSNGMIVEGFGILVKNTWQIMGEYQWRLPINRLGDTFFLQVVAVRQSSNSNEEAPWMALLNIHGIHTLRHFEASVRVREELEKFIHSAPWKGKYLGAIIAGDFNSKLYRPNSLPESEISSMPWEIKFLGEFDFSLRIGEQNIRKNLTRELFKINDSNEDATSRVNEVVDKFINLQRGSSLDSGFFNEALSLANKQGKCRPYNGLDSGCSFQYRIDHAFIPDSFTINNAYMIYRNNSFNNINSLTDHPGLVVELENRYFSSP